MRVLILGAGNLLLSDEGFGVHFIHFLRRHYRFPDAIELFDAGTLGLMAAHKLEEADRVYIVDIVAVPGEPGSLHRFAKEDFMLRRLPVKLSPHQAGIQEMLLVSELRGRCPREVFLLGAVASSLAPGVELSPVLAASLERRARELVNELRGLGFAIGGAGEEPIE
jgi:hydrogenase maturation protease